MYRGYNVALIIPCYNEEVAIGQVINDFREVIPSLNIFVFDNRSTDSTAEKALEAGAQVVRAPISGKGNVVRRMFADVEADIYIMVDGDATYDAKSITKLLDKLINERLDMVVGSRVTEQSIACHAYRQGHQWGNRLLTQSVQNIFGGKFKDMLSGYRVFSKRYVKSFPAISEGFETETELTVHALELRMPFGEIETPYRARPEGSESKLCTYKDGFRILKTILKLYVRERPIQFFGGTALFLLLIAIILFIPLWSHFIAEGNVPRFPTAILSSALSICALLSFVCGLIIDSITRARSEIKRLSYLSIPGISPKDDE